MTPRGNDVINAIDAANLPQGFSDQPVENNWFSSMLSLLIPVVLLGALFWFLLSRVTPRGNDVINAIDAANLPQGFSDQPVENNWFSS
ncbi:hypothetical protein CTI14_65850, partial [Methylobacterium radiotolerans]